MILFLSLCALCFFFFFAFVLFLLLLLFLVSHPHSPLSSLLSPLSSLLSPLSSLLSPRTHRYGSVERQIRHDVADALPGSSDALLGMVLEFLTENTLERLTSGLHRPSHMREDLQTKELSGSVAAFCLQMGLNRRTDAVESANREQRQQDNELRKEIAREVREQGRKHLVGSRSAQKKMLTSGGGGDFGSKARSARPSVILDRAKKRLLDDMKQHEEEEKEGTERGGEEEREESPLRRGGSGVNAVSSSGQPSEVLSKLLDPSKSPFAVGMTPEETEALRSQLPGTPNRMKRNPTNTAPLRMIEEAKLVQAASNKNRDARVAALSMLNE